MKITTEAIMYRWRAKRLSTMLKQALDDLRWVEKNPRKFKVNMRVWYVPAGSGIAEKGQKQCMVCLAGAHMARTVDGPKYLDPDADFSNDTAGKFYAINALREGRVGAALEFIGGNSRRGLLLNRPITAYTNRKLWWKQMRQLQRDLEKARL